ncbi:hypothetical protein [Paraburkholderia mimosarum]|uniref:hypothetical protein n=1 Tax=Paraburkholderia mimosarum TaxID=312026 RepID=UPI00048578CF|nr:hypothetical protein [Paraburkholderia mimosarum]
MPQTLEADDIAWLNSYATEVRNAFESVFAAAQARFEHGPRLVARFQKAVDKVRSGGRGNFRAVDEAHNELCIAEALLANTAPWFTKVEYEPILANCEKTIDFRAESDDGLIVYVDAKTIKPLSKDRWDQYERAVQEGWLPKNISVILNKEWLGGELWHYAFAARSQMLEYTLELEHKIAQSRLKDSGSVLVLALCGEGFHWHQDELEDFVAFYFSGTHRSDDPFALAEEKDINEKGIAVSRSVSRFACMQRPQGEVHWKRLNWNVQAPVDPAFL